MPAHFRSGWLGVTGNRDAEMNRLRYIGECFHILCWNQGAVRSQMGEILQDGKLLDRLQYGLLHATPQNPHYQKALEFLGIQDPHFHNSSIALPTSKQTVGRVSQPLLDDTLGNNSLSQPAYVDNTSAAMNSAPEDGRPTTVKLSATSEESKIDLIAPAQWKSALLLHHAEQIERNANIDFELSYHKLSNKTPPSLKQNHNDFTYQAFLLHAKNMMDELLHLMQEQRLSHLDSAAYETLYDLLQLECINIGCQSRTLKESLKAEEPYLMQLKRKAFYTGSHQNCIAYEEAFLARPTDSSQTINMNAPYQPSQQLIQRLINSQNYQRDVSSAFARVEHRIQGRNPDATSFLERLKDLILYKLSTLFRKKQIKSHPLYFARLFAQKATCRTAAEQTARAVIPSDRSPGITA